MARKPKTKMPVSERAKQFAPFAALNGMYETLAEEEKISMPKKELLSDAENSLNDIIVSAYTGMELKTVFYNDGKYETLYGSVTKVDEEKKKIYISDHEISFNDLYDMVAL